MTPHEVGERYCAAVAAMAGRLGPKAPRTSWPAMLIEFADLVDAEAFLRKSKERLRRPRPQLDSAAEEALRWPGEHLLRDPVGARALALWALARARIMRLERYFRVEREAASFLARGHMEAAPPHLRRAIRRQVAGLPWFRSKTTFHAARKRALKAIAADA